MILRARASAFGRRSRQPAWLNCQINGGWRDQRQVWFCRAPLGTAHERTRLELTEMAQRQNADLFEVLICEISKDGQIDVVLGKALSVLPETENGELAA